MEGNKEGTRLSLKHQIIAIISIVIIGLAIFLSIDLYMDHKFIMEISNQCYDINGFPVVERSSLFSGDFTFSCERQ